MSYEEEEDFVLFDYPVHMTRERFCKLVLKAMTLPEYLKWTALVHITDSIHYQTPNGLMAAYLEEKCAERAEAHGALTKAVYKVIYP